MWQITNQTPFSAEGYFLRDRRGTEHWVAAVRARFDIADDGLLKIAETKDPILLAPRYADGGTDELLCDSDIAPFKPKADFLIHGIACLPDMEAARTIEASVTIGSLTRRAAISCPRRLRKANGQTMLERGEPFGGVRLTWRNSLGGAETLPTGEASSDTEEHNPIGRGWTRRWRDLPDGAEILLPMIEEADNRIEPGKALPVPFGFGAVQPHWRPRRDHGGTYDAAWKKARAPLPPDDFDERFHQFAPPGQQMDLKGGETVTAENLHPDGPFFFRLPQLILEATTRVGRDRHETRFQIVTVELDTEAKTVAMVWNTAVECNGRDTQVDGSTIRVRQMAGVVR
jgi:hypothetical protein